MSTTELNNRELVLYARALRPWTDGAGWEKLLDRIGDLTGEPLGRLDTRDPVRRKVDETKGQGSYITKFAEDDSSRGLAGVFGSGPFGGRDVHISMETQKNAGHQLNKFALYIPEAQATKLGWPVMVALFEAVRSHLNPYYQFFDQKSVLMSRKRSEGGTYWHELHGMFWLTAFDDKLREFFGDDRFESIPHHWTDEGGVVVQLGDDPWTLVDSKRKDAERALGELSFSNFGRNKEPFVHVPHWKSLLAGGWENDIEM